MILEKIYAVLANILIRRDGEESYTWKLHHFISQNSINMIHFGLIEVEYYIKV